MKRILLIWWALETMAFSQPMAPPEFPKFPTLPREFLAHESQKPTNAVAFSPNGKFRLALTRLSPAASRGDVNLAATMQGIDGSTLWRVEVVAGDHILSYPRAVVSNEGDFFVMDTWSGSDGLKLFTAKGIHLVGTSHSLDKDFYFSPFDEIVETDLLDGRKIVRVWSEVGGWNSVAVEDGMSIVATPELIAKWNDATRERLLKKGNHRETGDYHFLALLKNPADRVIFERLFDGTTAAPEEFAAPFLPHGETRDDFVNSSSVRMGADWFLAVFDGKASKISAREHFYELASSNDRRRKRQPLHYLGGVQGTIDFATALVEPTGKLRIFLVEKPGDSAPIEMLERDATVSMWYDTAVSGTFAFRTVKPGRYFAKAVWDRREPFTDVMKPGPGDYESDFAGPFEIVAGQTAANINLVCTNRASAGAAFYAEDEKILRRWERSELASDYDKSSAGAYEWIIRTNSVAPGRRGWVDRITLSEERRHPGSSDTSPRSLQVYARQAGGNELHELKLLDEHGCRFSSFASDDHGVKSFSFYSFPRSAETWRLVGVSSLGDDLLDVTVTNRVRAVKRVADVEKFPVNLEFGALKVSIKGFEKNLLGMVQPAASIVENGLPASGWRISASFRDLDGNETSPAPLCREEKTVIVSGSVGKRGANPAFYRFEFAAPRALLP